MIRKLIKKILRIPTPPVARRYQALFVEIERCKARRILEIGTWGGGRAVEMIRKAQEFSDEVEYYGFDLFEQMTDEIHDIEVSKQPPAREEVQARLQETPARIRLFQGFTQETLPAALEELPPMDFIFIDGGHAPETVASDWKYCQQLMHDDTIVIFDDYWPEGYKGDRAYGPQAIVDAIDRDQYEVEILPTTDRFEKDWGPLIIQFARVTKRRSAS